MPKTLSKKQHEERARGGFLAFGARDRLQLAYFKQLFIMFRRRPYGERRDLLTDFVEAIIWSSDDRLNKRMENPDVRAKFAVWCRWHDGTHRKHTLTKEGNSHAQDPKEYRHRPPAL